MPTTKSVDQWNSFMAAEDIGVLAAMQDNGAAASAYNSRCRPLLFRISDGAQMLGMSPDSFERYVEPHIKLIRLGRMKLVPYAEMERFIAENAYFVGGVA